MEDTYQVPMIANDPNMIASDPDQVEPEFLPAVAGAFVGALLAGLLVGYFFNP